jgi:alkylation response protein AidB-like acyl-CoA dehydrogenase
MIAGAFHRHESNVNFDFSPDDEAFRLEVRSFIEANLPAEIAEDIRRWTNPKAENYRIWQRVLAAKGWGAPHWPAEWGGTDWSAIRKHIYMDEVYRAAAPDFFWQGTHMLGPVLIAFGSQAQKSRFLPRILRGEDCWCQGFSEPNAGSDLVNLRMTAVLEDDEYVINGQKIWTSDAVQADWGFFLVRTDLTVKPQRGLSFLVVKMDTLGVTVRPIRSIDGRSELNEVFLDRVRVPRDQLIGEPGKGWSYAKYLLEKERAASAFLYFNKRNLAKAKEIARRVRVDGVALIDTPTFNENLARVEADLLALEWSVLRILAQDEYRYDMNAVVSALKIRGSEMQQRVTQLQVDALGPLSLRRYARDESNDASLLSLAVRPPYTIGATSQYLFQRASTIYGGTREIQKNIIAKAAFGF